MLLLQDNINNNTQGNVYGDVIMTKSLPESPSPSDE